MRTWEEANRLIQNLSYARECHLNPTLSQKELDKNSEEFEEFWPLLADWIEERGEFPHCVKWFRAGKRPAFSTGGTLSLTFGENAKHVKWHTSKDIAIYVGMPKTLYSFCNLFNQAVERFAE